MLGSLDLVPILDPDLRAAAAVFWSEGSQGECFGRSRVATEGTS